MCVFLKYSENSTNKKLSHVHKLFEITKRKEKLGTTNQLTVHIISSLPCPPEKVQNFRTFPRICSTKHEYLVI